MQNATEFFDIDLSESFSLFLIHKAYPCVLIFLLCTVYLGFTLNNLESQNIRIFCYLISCFLFIKLPYLPL